MSVAAREGSATRSTLSASAITDDIELAVQIPSPLSSSTLTNISHRVNHEDDVISLEPVDRGSSAWSFLAGAFVVQTIVWSFPNAYGVFLSTYKNDSKFSSQPRASSLLPLVGTLSSGIIYCSSPFWNALMRRYPKQRRPAMWAGALLCFVSLMGASYARTVNELVALQGVLYALGASLTYQPTMAFMSEWFVERRGMANGVMFAGTGLGGIFLPLILPPLIEAHGTAVSLRYLSIAVISTLILVIPFVKPRLPENRIHGPGRRENSGMPTADWRFWTLLLINTLQGFAYFVPILYLPSFASTINNSASLSALAVALLNGGSVVSRLGMGTLSDHFSPWLLASCALLLSSAATFILWGIAGSATGGVLVFGVMYGLVASGWSSLWNGFVKPMSRNDPERATSLFSILLLSRGLGNVLSAPISTVLIAKSHTVISRGKTGFGVDGGKYESTIIYVGTCFAIASILTFAGFLRESVLVKQTN